MRVPYTRVRRCSVYSLLQQNITRACLEMVRARSLLHHAAHLFRQGMVDNLREHESSRHDRHHTASHRTAANHNAIGRIECSRQPNRLGWACSYEIAQRAVRSRALQTAIRATRIEALLGVALLLPVSLTGESACVRVQSQQARGWGGSGWGEKTADTKVPINRLALAFRTCMRCVGAERGITAELNSPGRSPQVDIACMPANGRSCGSVNFKYALPLRCCYCSHPRLRWDWTSTVQCADIAQPVR